MPQAPRSNDHHTYRCYLRGPDGIRGLSLCGPGARFKVLQRRRHVNHERPKVPVPQGFSEFSPSAKRRGYAEEPDVILVATGPRPHQNGPPAPPALPGPGASRLQPKRWPASSSVRWHPKGRRTGIHSGSLLPRKPGSLAGGQSGPVPSAPPSHFGQELSNRGSESTGPPLPRPAFPTLSGPRFPFRNGSLPPTQAPDPGPVLACLLWKETPSQGREKGEWGHWRPPKKQSGSGGVFPGVGADRPSQAGGCRVTGVERSPDRWPER